MNIIAKKEEKNDIKTSNRHFDQVVKISLIIGIIIVSGFIVYYLLNPEPGYVTFGILNENQKAENYQTKASINETIPIYLSVGNYLDREFMFRFKIKKGNNNTVISSTGSNGTSYQTIGNFTLNPNELQIYGEYNVSFSEEGTNQIIIAELWQIKHEIEELFIIHYLRLNITG
ncbi:MAG: DUF1616 domain-containing protein [Promethearchaeota archaeon]